MYEKLDVELSKSDFELLMSFKDRPIASFLQKIGIEKQLQDILLYAIGCFNESQQNDDSSDVDTFSFFERI